MKQRPQAPKGDVKVFMRESPDFEVDGIRVGCNLQPFRGLGFFLFHEIISSMTGQVVISGNTTSTTI